MPGIIEYIGLSLRLNFRNRMAMIYGFLFPVLFLLVFRTLYRQEHAPLTSHAGELLTVTILAGACFGLPTGIVSDRERGVWRRSKILPVSGLTLLSGAVVTRYLLLLAAGLVQLILALAFGMRLPAHPVELFAAFSLGAAAFIGIGLVLAMLAPTVPAVQALGQCVFLPMLIIGGVAVPLSNLPSWAVALSTFLPGRYAVQALQSCVNGAGLAAAPFVVTALAIFALTAGCAGALSLRWESRQRPSLWLTVGLAGFVGVGLMAETRPRTPEKTAPPLEEAKADDYIQQPPPVIAAPSSPAPVVRKKGPASWREVTDEDIAGVAFDRLPPDDGVVAPIAGPGDVPTPDVADQMAQLQDALDNWAPGKVDDPVQRVRNFLYAAAVPDVYRMDPMERFAPLILFDRMQRSVPDDSLPKVLYWIALHPAEGDISASRKLADLGLPDGPDDARPVRNRAMIYAFKLLAKLEKFNKNR